MTAFLWFNDAKIFVYPTLAKMFLICSNGIIIVRINSLEQVLGNSFASCYRFWLCFTFCAQSMSLDRQNALDSLNWILVLKHIWQKKESQSLINWYYNPWSKYYILNLLFIKTTFELPGLMIGEAINCVCMQVKTNYYKQHSYTAMADRTLILGCWNNLNFLLQHQICIQEYKVWIQCNSQCVSNASQHCSDSFVIKKITFLKEKMQRQCLTLYFC